jgi:hypothetical protein
MENLDISVLYAKYENLKEMVSAEDLLENFVQQMSSNALQSYLEDACKDYDIDFEDDI